jgi:hypothetical protein
LEAARQFLQASPKIHQSFQFCPVSYFDRDQALLSNTIEFYGREALLRISSVLRPNKTAICPLGVVQSLTAICDMHEYVYQGPVAPGLRWLARLSVRLQSITPLEGNVPVILPVTS